ncbi:MAG: hypothetical protein P8Y45_05420 [Exilibacterium sp.]
MPIDIQSTRIGDLLIKRGEITTEQLNIAIAEQRRRRRLITEATPAAKASTALGEILVDLGYLERKQLLHSLTWQKRLRKVSFALAFVTPLLSVTAPASAGTSTSSKSYRQASDSNYSWKSGWRFLTQSFTEQDSNETTLTSTGSLDGTFNDTGTGTADGTSSDTGTGTADGTSSDTGTGTADCTSNVTSTGVEEPTILDNAVALSWLIPELRLDGSNLSLSEIGGYEIVYQRQGDPLSYSIIVDDPNLSYYIIENLETGNYEFMIAAFDADGMFSEFAKPVYKFIE